MKQIIKDILQIEKDHGEEKELFHHNCAETLLLAANEKYNLGLDKKTIKAITPFGGGINCERTCGALTGSIAAIGVMFTEEKPTLNTKMKENTKNFLEIFEKEFGSIDCSYIKAHHRSETEGCTPVEKKTGEMLEKFISENK